MQHQNRYSLIITTICVLKFFYENVDLPERRQTETSTNNNVGKPKRQQTESSTNQNHVDQPENRQTETSTNQNVDTPKL